MSKWIASKYVYLDGARWNQDRWEILAPDATGTLRSVGGAMKTIYNGTIAFLCFESDQISIRRPVDAQSRSLGNFVWGESLLEALNRLKFHFPHPHEVLEEMAKRTMVGF